MQPSLITGKWKARKSDQQDSQVSIFRKTILVLTFLSFRPFLLFKFYFRDSSFLFNISVPFNK